MSVDVESDKALLVLLVRVKLELNILVLVASKISIPKLAFIMVRFEKKVFVVRKHKTLDANMVVFSIVVLYTKYKI